METFLESHESISSPEAEDPQPERSVVGAEDEGTLRAMLSVMNPGFGFGPPSCVIVFLRVSMASVLDRSSRDTLLILSSWSFGRNRPSLDAAPPWITLFIKIPMSTMCPPEAAVVLPFTLIPNQKEHKTFRHYKNLPVFTSNKKLFT